MGMKEMQVQVDNWIKEYGVRYFNVQTNTIILMEEIGEFSKLVARVYGEQSFKNEEDRMKAPDNIKEELSDILFVITCLANQMDIDLDEAMKENMAKKTSRDSKRHKMNPKLSQP
jgi:NTP pyrophosphatase (non-canonical NTP hydrolase)